MKSRKILAAAMLLATYFLVSTRVGSGNELRPINEENAMARDLSHLDLKAAAKSAILAEIVRLEARSNRDVVVRVNLQSVSRIRSEALQAMFPEYAFIRIAYHMSRAKGSRADVAVPEGLYTVAAVHVEKGTATALPGHGDRKEFGEFLASRGIRLRNSEDAARVWRVFCDLYGRRPSDATHVRTSPTRWKLGLRTDTQVRATGQSVSVESYLEIITDSEGTITEGVLKFTTVPLPSSERNSS